jgi:hypothetical protein
MITGALGFPKGVLRSCSEMSSRPGILYKPEPPMMARVGFIFIENLLLRRVLFIVPEKEIEPQI